MGQHIAAVIRGEPVFKPGEKLTIERARRRRFAVKRIVTIGHLYGVGVGTAAKWFCEAEGIDDVNGDAAIKHKDLVRDMKKQAKSGLGRTDLSDHDKRHYEAIVNGLYPNLPKGCLKGQDYPEAFDRLRKELENGNLGEV